jgi:hypothetical protein
MIDKAKADQEVSWIGARLREPSTYAGLTGIILAFHLTADPQGWVQVATMLGEGLGALIAILLPEKS